jgi:hypothetical protein
LQCGDRRPQAVRCTPGHALSEQERERILQIANEPRFCGSSTGANRSDAG